MKEFKVKIKLTSDEVAILKSVTKRHKYIARDNNGLLTMYEEKPKKNDDYGIYVLGDAGGSLTPLYNFSHIFQNITFESGAHLIADLIKENENEKIQDISGF